MGNEQHHDDVRHLWQSQMDENTPTSLDDLRSRLSKTNRAVLARTFVAGLALLVFIGFFAVALTWTVSTLVTKSDIKMTQCIFLIGAGFSFWKLISLIRRAQGQSVTDGEPSACVAFYQSELKRQRDSHRRSALWVPLAFSALWVWSLLVMQQLRLIMIIVWVLFVPFWVYQNLKLARTAQRELHELMAASGKWFG